MTNRQIQDARRLVRLAALLALVTVIVIVLDKLTGCSSDVKDRIVEAPPETTAAACDELPLGETRDVECEHAAPGRRTEICTARGLETAVDTCERPAPGTPGPCSAPGTTTFAAVRPILSRSCVSCHAGFDAFQTARDKATKFITRVSLLADDSQRMPRDAPPLAKAEVDLLKKWQANGLCPEDNGTDSGTNIARSLDYIEQRLIEDGTSSAVEPRIRDRTRWLSAAHRLDSAEDARTWRLAVTKALNSISTDQKIHIPTEIEPGLLRIDIRDYGIDATRWRQIEDADQLDLESNTSRGKILKLLIGTRRPWIQVDGFDDTVLRSSATYYSLTRAARTFNEQMRIEGVNYAVDLANFDAATAGFNGSPLSNENRLVSWHESINGSCFTTYDVGPTDTPEKNLFNFPCLGDVGCVLNFQYVAGETICTKANGLQNYFLSISKQTFRQVPGPRPNDPPRNIFVRSDLDQRIDAADPNVVHDFTPSNPNSPIIISGISCFRCHSAGILPIRDQIAEQVKRNGGAFGNDKDKILAIYHGSGRDTFGEAVTNENANYAQALQEMDIDPTAPDPISHVNDRFLNVWNLKKLADYVGRDVDELSALISQSAVAQAQVGQLLTPNGTITYDQLVQSIEALKDALQIYEDPLIR